MAWTRCNKKIGTPYRNNPEHIPSTHRGSQLTRCSRSFDKLVGWYLAFRCRYTAGSTYGIDSAAQCKKGSRLWKTNQYARPDQPQAEEVYSESNR